MTCRSSTECRSDVLARIDRYFDLVEDDLHTLQDYSFDERFEAWLAGNALDNFIEAGASVHKLREFERARSGPLGERPHAAR